MPSAYFLEVYHTFGPILEICHLSLLPPTFIFPSVKCWVCCGPALDCIVPKSVVDAHLLIIIGAARVYLEIALYPCHGCQLAL